MDDDMKAFLLLLVFVLVSATLGFMAGREGPVDARDALCTDLYAAQTTRVDSLEVYVRHPYCTLEEDDG